ncbi:MULTISPECIES: NAD(+) diphosphatase [unclassified Moraxella]|uniref:NAD(+) diphosphatase n=1 Tax=unclassified Moraxella TaxID=2685852 RepID=UPI003AF51D32
MRHQLLIVDNDKFACIGGLVFFYSCENNENLPPQAVKIADNSPNDIYAVHYTDFIEHGLTLPNGFEFRPFRQLIADLTHEQANQLSKAMQLLRWRDDHHFCSRCGTPTHFHTSENATVCPNCGYHQYPRIQPCIITAIVKHDNGVPKILLAHHHRAKDSGMYGLIAGFVEVGESLEQCVHREVAEEVGLQVANLRYMSSQPWAFPSNLMIGFVADYVSGEVKIQEDELIHADFFAFDNLPKIPPKGTIAYQLIEMVKNANSIL